MKDQEGLYEILNDLFQYPCQGLMRKKPALSSAPTTMAPGLFVLECGLTGLCETDPQVGDHLRDKNPPVPEPIGLDEQIVPLRGNKSDVQLDP